MKRKFFADFHLHSKYSIATSKKADLFNYSKMARMKGIQLIGTGDGTHPAWIEEMERYLIQDSNSGFYKLNDEMEGQLKKDSPYPWVNEINYFVPTSEISTIYKKNGKVRKVHHLFIFPNITKIKEFSKYLDERANVRSDGRPILGFRSEQLFEIALTICPEVIYIPAHIWTPHFSVYGAKSGYDSIEECFGSLIKNIYAVETGLSSDPPMNWRVSELDRFFLVSNSDAHGPDNLGREANYFDCDFSYEGILSALKGDNSENLLQGTIEFFPEQGKYHYDGHRKCGISLSPEEAYKNNYICPVCNKPLTYGVYHRVMELADKPSGQKSLKSRSFKSIVPLPKILSECLNKGEKTKTIQEAYHHLIRRNCSEFDMLLNRDLDTIKSDNPFLKIALERVRNSELCLTPGFDGEYGTASIFSEKEKQSILHESFTQFGKGYIVYKPEKKKKSIVSEQLSLSLNENNSVIETRKANDKQNQVIYYPGKALLVQAGPGTGKTFCLLERIKYLSHTSPLDKIVAVTFTENAAKQINEKLDIHRTPKTFGTFHSISMNIYKEYNPGDRVIVSDSDKMNIVKCGMKELNIKEKLKLLLNYIEQKKNYYFSKFEIWDIGEKIYQYYESFLQNHSLCDFDDLLIDFIKLVQEHEEIQFEHLLVDEIQDCNHLQYEWIKTVANRCRTCFFIGDYYQSIYQFRGAEPLLIFDLKKVFTELETVSLNISYRLKPNLIKCSKNIISSKPIYNELISNKKEDFTTVDLYEQKNEKIEKSFIVLKIKEILGLNDMSMISSQDSQYSLSDVAVLFRTRERLQEYSEYFSEKKLPVTIYPDRDWVNKEQVQLVLNFIRASVFPDNQFYLESLEKFYHVKLDISCYIKIKDIKRLIEKFCLDMKIELNNDLFLLIDYLSGFSHWKEEVIKLLMNQPTNKTSNNIQLLTMHGAKGLEFPVVFLPCLEEGYTPLSSEKKTDREEFLFYVACTRSSSKLILSYSKYRNGQQNPSRFIEKIRKDIHWKKNIPEDKKPYQMKLF